MYRQDSGSEKLSYESGNPIKKAKMRILSVGKAVVGEQRPDKKGKNANFIGSSPGSPLPDRTCGIISSQFREECACRLTVYIVRGTWEREFCSNAS